ncbi:MAG TPA: hypothetical protein PK544_11400 [Spirochaetota bacterium]|nr:hypothetical protein [Spirochaetota bacterium]
MRDDIQQLALELLKHYENKLALLKKILTSETDKRYYLKTGSFDELEELFSNDNHIIDIVNTIDVDIMNIKSRICNISGIEEKAFERLFFHTQNEVSGELKNKIAEIGKVLTSIQEDRKYLIQNMEQQRNSLKTDIQSLSFYGKFKKD